MRWITGLIPSVVIGFAVGGSPAAAQMHGCPSVGGQSIPVDGATGYFDSILQKFPDGRVNIVHCIKFDPPKPERLIDWSEADLVNVGTRSGYIMTNRPIDEQTHLSESHAYIGINRKLVQPKLLKENNLKFKITKLIETYFFGSVSTANRGNPDQEARLVPVELLFVADVKDANTASLTISNKSSSYPGDLRFTVPEVLRASIPELSDELRIRNEPTVITYKVNVAEAAVQRTRITFRNSDRQEVAGMAIDLIVPAERPR